MCPIYVTWSRKYLRKTITDTLMKKKRHINWTQMQQIVIQYYYTTAFWIGNQFMITLHGRVVFCDTNRKILSNFRKNRLDSWKTVPPEFSVSFQETMMFWSNSWVIQFFKSEIKVDCDLWSVLYHILGLNQLQFAWILSSQFWNRTIHTLRLRVTWMVN